MHTPDCSKDRLHSFHVYMIILTGCKAHWGIYGTPMMQERLKGLVWHLGAADLAFQVSHALLLVVKVCLGDEDLIRP